MRTNPEPDYLILIPHRQRAIRETNAGRKDRLRCVHLLKAQTGVKRILPKELIGKTCLGLHLRRQGSEGLVKPLGRVGVQS